jgi:hypothetical protein
MELNNIELIKMLVVVMARVNKIDQIRDRYSHGSSKPNFVIYSPPRCQRLENVFDHTTTPIK